MTYAERYARNTGLFSDEDQQRLAASTAAVVGLGGLGGYVAEQLARLGVGHLILIDGDVVDESNLNRQLFATEAVIGRPKAEVACTRMRSINSTVDCRAHAVLLDADNAEGLLVDADIVVDALDNVASRLAVQDACAALDLTLVHGAIAGWYGQVAVIRPGDATLTHLYPDGVTHGIETTMGTPSFTPGMVASVQAAEAAKYLLGREEVLSGQVLYLDLLTHAHLLLDIG